MLAENEADASEIEEINALIEPDKIKKKTGVGEIRRGELGIRDHQGSCWKDRKGEEIGKQGE